MSNKDFLQVAKVSKDAKLPTRKFSSDAGIDFYALEKVTLQPLDMLVLHTGIVVDIPKGYELHLYPKGSSNWLVGSGVVDESYTGEIMVKLFNTTNSTISINAGDPICQGVLRKVITPMVTEVDYNYLISHKKTERGATGGIHNDAGVSSIDELEDLS